MQYSVFMSHTQIQCAVQRAPSFFQETKILKAFIWTLTRHNNKLGLLQKQHRGNFGKFSPGSLLFLPGATGCRMDLLITHAVKPRKLITDSYGPQLTGLIRATDEDESCVRVTWAPCWACICVLYIQYMY